MSPWFKPDMHVLPPAQQRLWPSLRGAPSLGFVLYGGTALALRLGHRPSIDFDFFSDAPIDKAAIASAFPFMDKSYVLTEKEDTYTILVALDAATDAVKLSFFGSIGFGRVGEPEFTEDGVLQVASLADLMATKLKVILQRAEAKDYRDIAALIGAGVSLPRGLSSAVSLYGRNFQPSESLKALTFFKDGDLDSLDSNIRTTLIQAADAVRELPPVAKSSTSLSVTSPARVPTPAPAGAPTPVSTPISAPAPDSDVSGGYSPP
jgi:hypothetical protein